MSSRSPSDKPYRAAVIGCGRIGCGFDDDPKRTYVSTHAGAYAKSSRAELAALCDLEEEKVASYVKKFGAMDGYTDVDAMLSEVRPEIVSLCTLADTHQALCEKAVKAGVKAIFCEKPIADSLAAADEMIELCKANDVLLAIGHQRRFDAFHQDVKRYIDEGGLGEVRQVTCYYVAGAANTGSHLFDLLRFFFGDFDEVQGRYSHVASPNSSDPNIDGVLWRQGGPTVAIQACDVKDYVLFELNIVGSKGRLRIGSSGFSAGYDGVFESPHFEGHQELLPAESPVDPSGHREFLLRAVEHICDCLDQASSPMPGTDGMPVALVSTGEDGRKALEIICALRMSAEQGGSAVSLPLTGDVVLRSK